MKNGPGLKMYFLLNMGDIPASYVSIPECTSLFLPPGEMIQFDEHIFQMGWFNHQLDTNSLHLLLSRCFLNQSNHTKSPMATWFTRGYSKLGTSRFTHINVFAESSLVLATTPYAVPRVDGKMQRWESGRIFFGAYGKKWIWYLDIYRYAIWSWSIPG